MHCFECQDALLGELQQLRSLLSQRLHFLQVLYLEDALVRESTTIKRRNYVKYGLEAQYTRNPFPSGKMEVFVKKK